MISLALIDENWMLKLSLSQAFESGCGIEVVGVFDLAGESVSEIKDLNPDLVLIGMKWPPMDRIDICRKLRQECPKTRVLMLASEVRDEEVLASIMAGASGYIAMNARRSELIRAIHIVAGGSSYFESSAVDRVIGRLQEMRIVADVHAPDDLTEREVLILNMIAEGWTNEEIGKAFGVAVKTTRNNITEIRRKLGLGSRAQLAAYAARREILHELHLRSGG